MMLPPYQEFVHPLLRALAARPTGLTTQEAYSAVATLMSLTPAQRAQELKNGQSLYQNRIGWANDRLKRAMLSEAPGRGVWRLTQSGAEFLDRNKDGIEDTALRELVAVADNAADSTTDAGMASFPSFASVMNSYETTPRVRELVAHNFDVWLRIIGSHVVATRHRVELDPRDEYWRLVERRVLVSYFADAFKKKFAPAEALRTLAFRTFRHFDTERRGGRFGEPIPAAAQPARWEELQGRLVEAAATLPGNAEYLRLKAVWGNRLAAASLSSHFTTYIEEAAGTEGPGDLEKPFFERLVWLPYLDLQAVEGLRDRQRFFHAYYVLFTSTNSYRGGGSQSFGPILQNNATGLMLDYVARWAHGETPDATGFFVNGRASVDARNCSHHNAVVELFGFLNVHRQPYFNNATEAAYQPFEREGDTSVFPKLERIGERTREFLQSNDGLVTDLAARARALFDLGDDGFFLEMEGIASKVVLEAHPEEAELQADLVLRSEILEEGRAHLTAMSDADVAAMMLHFMLDSTIYARREQPGAGPSYAPSQAPLPSVREPVAVSLPPAPDEARLHLPPSLRSVGNDALAYLRAGFHVLFAGAPGTGKTTLAQLVGHAWNADASDVPDDIGISQAPMTTVGNSAWSPFHTIGGVIPGVDGKFECVPGIFIDPSGPVGTEWRLRPEALVLDEMNRADLDRCIGELYPLLSRSVACVHPAGIPGVSVIRAHERFRILATVNDATLDDIVFPISEGLARRFIRFELPGATIDELRSFLDVPGLEPDQRKRAAAIDMVKEFFDMCDASGRLVGSDQGRRLPFGAGYFAPLQAWVGGSLVMSPAFRERDVAEQARVLLVGSLRTAARLEGFDEIFRKLRAIEDVG